MLLHAEHTKLPRDKIIELPFLSQKDESICGPAINWYERTDISDACEYIQVSYSTTETGSFFLYILRRTFSGLGLHSTYKLNIYSCEDHVLCEIAAYINFD